MVEGYDEDSNDAVRERKGKNDAASLLLYNDLHSMSISDRLGRLDALKEK